MILKKKILSPDKNYIKVSHTRSLINENRKKSIEKYDTKRNILYKPIKKNHPFNFSTIGINEILKKSNLSLITNKKMKNIFIKYKEERAKEIKAKKILYRNRSFCNPEEEKSNRFKMLKALLKKDYRTIHNLMDKEKKNKILNGNNSYRGLSFLNKDSLNNDKSLPILLPLQKKNGIKQKIHSDRIFLINKTKNSIWKKEIFSKFKKEKDNINKNSFIKIKSAYSISSIGKISPHNLMDILYKNTGQDTNFCFLNMNSAKLGNISLFGIIDGNGPYGKQISSIVKDYIIDYFKNSEEMKVTLKKDNFYSIMYNAFTNAQNYLIKNSSKLKINLNYSGANGCILLYPHNNTNKIYCANLGRNKCILYTMYGTIRLSFDLYSERASEKYRISLMKKNKDKLIINNSNHELIKILINDENSKNTITTNNSNITSNSYENIKDIQNINDNAINKDIYENEKDIYLKDFLELDISRCVGNLVAEDYGIIPGPEVVENDIKVSRGKFIVMGTMSLWKYLKEDEVGEIVNKYLNSGDCIKACRELENIAIERWKMDKGGYNDISVSIVFFDYKNVDIRK